MDLNLPCMEIAHGIDVLEEKILLCDERILKIMLSDKSTGKNILWATKDYEFYGSGYEEFSEITADLITGGCATLIQPRIAKSQMEQEDRTRTKAEVFTPSWICNKQNNLVDTKWFCRPDVFNREIDAAWDAIIGPVSFGGCKKDWQEYIDAKRLEVSCGEAPYLVSRYDAVTGESIPVHARIGLLDRKMRIVAENAQSEEKWMRWGRRAFESVYGFEYQGDNLLLARENLFYTYIDYYRAYFGENPGKKNLEKIANIIAWNIWQMDGLRFVVPGSCHEVPKERQMEMFNTIMVPCPGCMKGDIYSHNGVYCRVQDWRRKTSGTFISLFRGRGG